jgi:hypothetical protein
MVGAFTPLPIKKSTKSVAAKVFKSATIVGLSSGGTWLFQLLSPGAKTGLGGYVFFESLSGLVIVLSFCSHAMMNSAMIADKDIRTKIEVLIVIDFITFALSNKFLIYVNFLGKTV